MISVNVVLLWNKVWLWFYSQLQHIQKKVTNMCFDLNNLICTKIPKPQTVELGDSELFLSVPNCLSLPGLFHNPAVYVWSKLACWSSEKKFTNLTDLTVLYIQVRLYYAFIWPIEKKGRKKVGYLSR